MTENRYTQTHTPIHIQRFWLQIYANETGKIHHSTLFTFDVQFFVRFFPDQYFPINSKKNNR